MRIELSPRSQAKLDDILEELYTKYDMEDLTPEELLDALLDIAMDLIVADQASIPAERDRLINICSQKIMQRA